MHSFCWLVQDGTLYVHVLDVHTSYETEVDCIWYSIKNHKHLLGTAGNWDSIVSMYMHLKSSQYGSQTFPLQTQIHFKRSIFKTFLLIFQIFHLDLIYNGYIQDVYNFTTCQISVHQCRFADHIHEKQKFQINFNNFWKDKGKLYSF